MYRLFTEQCDCRGGIQNYMSKAHRRILLDDAVRLQEVILENPYQAGNAYRGDTPLVTAIRNDSKQCFNLLLKYEVDIEQQTSKNETPLVVAVKMNLLHFVQILLEKGAKIKTKTKDGYSLSKAILKKDNAEALQLIQNNRSILADQGNKDEDSILSDAIYAGARRCISYILSLTPPMAHLVTRKGCDPIDATIRNDDETTLRIMSHMEGFDELIKGSYYIHTAADHKRPNMVKIFLDHGADPNKIDRDNCTPMQHAKDSLTAKYLVEAGATPTKRKRGDESPIWERKCTRDHKVDEYLFEYKKHQRYLKKDKVDLETLFQNPDCTHPSHYLSFSPIPELSPLDDLPDLSAGMTELLQIPGLTEMDLVAHEHDEGFNAPRE